MTISRRHGGAGRARDELQKFVVAWTRAGGAPVDHAEARLDELLTRYDDEVRYAMVHLIREMCLRQLRMRARDEYVPGLEFVAQTLQLQLEQEDGRLP